MPLTSPAAELYLGQNKTSVQANYSFLPDGSSLQRVSPPCIMKEDKGVIIRVSQPIQSVSLHARLLGG